MRFDLFSDIELDTGTRGKHKHAQQYYIQFSVGDMDQSTKEAKEKNSRTSWDDAFYL